MSQSTATVGFGSLLAYATIGAAPTYTVGSYTEIAQTRDLPGPEPEIGEVKITNNDSPDKAHEYLPGGGLIEPGEFEFEVVYKKSVQASLYTMFGDGNNYSWRETFPDGSTWKFVGYLKSLGQEAPTEDEAISSTWTIKVTGKPVFTPGT